MQLKFSKRCYNEYIKALCTEQTNKRITKKKNRKLKKTLLNEMKLGQRDTSALQRGTGGRLAKRKDTRLRVSVSERQFQFVQIKNGKK